MKLPFVSLFFLPIFVGITLSLACEKETLSVGEGDVLIRIENNSSYRFKDIFVRGIIGENNYGNLSAGRTSDYKAFTEIYRYAYIKLSINGREYILQPIDFVGETPLADGKYTYQISVADINSEWGLNLTLRED